MKRFVLLALVLLLTACSTIERVPTDYKGADSGRVVVSIGATDKVYSHYALLFRKRDETLPVEKRAIGQFNYSGVSILPMMRRGDYNGPHGRGDVLVQTLPPGEYEIYSYKIHMYTGMAEATYWSNIPLSIPFSVKAGETVYLGNYTAYKQTGKNIIGIPVPAGAVFVVESRLSEDLAVARKKGETVPETVVDLTPKPAQLTTPVFVARENFRLP